MMIDLSIKIKEVGIDKLDNNSFTNKIPFLKSASRSIKKFMKRYETIEVQIDRIENELEKVRMQMLKDISMFDVLYQKNLDYFCELQVYISAGEEKLTELREVTLPSYTSKIIC